MTESGAKLILWVAAAALVGARMAIPQPVDPWEMPGLVLDRAKVAQDVEQNQELAATLAESDEVTRLQSLFIGHGLSELSPPYHKVDYDNRQLDIHRGLIALEEAHGPNAFAALRARAVEDFMTTFRDVGRKPESDEEIGAAGGFVHMLEKYGAIDSDVRIAPEMTVRAMYKARWNLIHRAPATDGFTLVELRAYWGWLALHGWGVPLTERIDALRAYGEAGGRNTQEAGALFDLLSRDPNRAANRLQALYDEKHQLRLRNLALGAMHAAYAMNQRDAPP
ncbi:MAG: hypothetical protein WBG86_03695 [Polyangiales bacterium]